MSVGYAQAETTYAVESDGRRMESPKKVKKAGFFKRWLLKSVKDAVEIERKQQQEAEAVNQVSTAKYAKSLAINSGPSIDQPDRAINFTVYVANGGRIVETRKYDRKTDRHNNGLYIITNDQDFGREIDKIIVMEGLK